MALDPKQFGERTWTVDDYMEIEDERRFELLSGELLMVPSPNIFHQRAITKLGTLIDSHATEHDLGECFDAPFDVVLAEDTVVQPDFTFVRKDRIADLYDGHCITGAPDLVVEALSESTESRDRHRKRQIYAEADVEWLVFVEPKGQVVEVQRQNDEGQYVTVDTAAENDTLHIGLFPELAIDLADVWFEAPDQTAEGAD